MAAISMKLPSSHDSRLAVAVTFIFIRQSSSYGCLSSHGRHLHMAVIIILRHAYVADFFVWLLPSSNCHSCMAVILSSSCDSHLHVAAIFWHCSPSSRSSHSSVALILTGWFLRVAVIFVWLSSLYGSHLSAIVFFTWPSSAYERILLTQPSSL